MKSSPLSFVTALAATVFLLHVAACGSGTSGTGGSTTTHATGGATTTSSTTTHTTTMATGGMGTGGSGSDAGSDGGGSLCTQTGGAVTMVLCCTGAGDFPSTCTTGACGCAPSSSQMVRGCACPGSECYDPTNGCMNQI